MITDVLYETAASVWRVEDHRPEIISSRKIYVRIGLYIYIYIEPNNTNILRTRTFSGGMAQLIRKAQQFENTKELNAITNIYDQ
jgi:hypothetical protein